MTLIKKLRKAKKECEEGEKPNTVRTHLRNMTIVPEMIGSIVGVYNGKTFNQVSLPAASVGYRGGRGPQRGGWHLGNVALEVRDGAQSVGASLVQSGTMHVTCCHGGPAA